MQYCKHFGNHVRHIFPRLLHSWSIAVWPSRGKRSKFGDGLRIWIHRESPHARYDRAIARLVNIWDFYVSKADGELQKSVFEQCDVNVKQKSGAAWAVQQFGAKNVPLDRCNSQKHEFRWSWDEQEGHEQDHVTIRGEGTLTARFLHSWAQVVGALA